MATETERLSLDQRRAAFAYRVVSLIGKDKGVKEDYTTSAQNLPTMVLQIGLGQTVAFLMSKAKGQEGSAHGKLLDQLAKWLFDEADEKKKVEERRPFVKPVGATGTERLMEALLNAERHEWSRAQHEAVAFGTWLKRFAEALIPKKDGGTKEEEP